ncbi:MAG: RNase P subunit p30 family protein [Candidatus Bathyarchaeia archaeon]
MKRAFADLHLNLKNAFDVPLLIRKAAALGYKLIAAPLAPQTIENEAQLLQAMCRDVKIDFASRVDIKPKNPNDLTRQLQKLRRKVEIICVICENKEVARQAAKDHRVDLLNFPSIDTRKRFFNAAEAELACNSLAALEIDTAPLLTLEGPPRIRLLASLRREIAIAIKFQVPIVLSSGASNVLLLRKPREQAFLTSLLDLNESAALDAVSTNPVAIVKRNRQKLSAGFVAPGIRIIREGKDC